MPLPKIETHLNQSPTRMNNECPYSLGILNLTKDEARAIGEFVQTVQRDRVIKVEQRDPAYAKALAEYERDYNDAMRYAVMQQAREVEGELRQRRAGMLDKAEEQEQIAAPSNRFSELDIE